MPLTIVRNDITKMDVDAIVNAANNQLQQGGGVCGAIFSAAGADSLQKECNAIGPCKTGDSVLTKGYDLPAKHIIHTVGPVWQGGTNHEQELLQSCYTTSLRIAKEYGMQSIAFPLISTGVFGYPRDQALHVATSAISAFLVDHDIDVYLVVFDKQSFAISQKLFSAVEKFIDDNYIDDNFELDERSRLYSARIEHSLELEEASFDSLAMPSADYSLDDVLNNLGETFSVTLIKLIDKRGLKDVDVYKKANIDRKLFSKIKNNKAYKPSKSTALAFAVALELNLDQTQDLLKTAGFALSHSNKFDVIIEYFISEKNYNIFELNETLFAFDQPLLGA